MEMALEPFLDSISWSPIDVNADPGRRAGRFGSSAMPPIRRRAPGHSGGDGVGRVLGRYRRAPTIAIEQLPGIDWLAESLRSFPPIDAGRFQLRRLAYPPRPCQQAGFR